MQFYSLSSVCDFKALPHLLLRHVTKWIRVDSGDQVHNLLLTSMSSDITSFGAHNSLVTCYECKQGNWGQRHSLCQSLNKPLQIERRRYLSMRELLESWMDPATQALLPEALAGLFPLERDIKKFTLLLQAPWWQSQDVSCNFSAMSGLLCRVNNNHWGYSW